MSIDIDSFDYYVFGSIKKYRPKICIVETSSGYTPDRDFVSRDAGCSLKSVTELGETIGYKCVIHTGNAFFVRDDLVHLLPDYDYSLESIYSSPVTLIVDKVSNGTSYFREHTSEDWGINSSSLHISKNFINNKEERHICADGSNFRNKEIYDLVWGENPYIKGVMEGERTAGDLESIEVKNHTGNWISNWEYLHGLEPTNIRPKIYYEPHKIPGLGDTILVDLSTSLLTTMILDMVTTSEMFRKHTSSY